MFRILERPIHSYREASFRVVELCIAFLTFPAYGALCFFVYLAVQTREIKPLKASLVVLFGGLTLVTTARFLEAVRHETLHVESHWGGLGGGLGGWRVSRSLAYLLASLAFSVLLASLMGAGVTPAPVQPSADAVKAKPASNPQAPETKPDSKQ